MPEILSPCNGDCHIRVGYCVGCKRTSEEIAEWRAMSDDQKRKVLTKVGERKNAQNQEGTGRGD